jgi:TAP-like protein
VSVAARVREALRELGAPSLVISGKNDPLIRWRGGRDTAARLSVARFVVYPATGHAIPASSTGTSSKKSVASPSTNDEPSPRDETESLSGNLS